MEQSLDRPSVPSALGKGALAGFGGTAAMTAFQKLVEMPLTGREDSYAPADFLQRVLPLGRQRGARRRALNYAGHFGIGVAWGVAHGMVERSGLHGQRAVATVFAAIYVGDGLLNTALGLYQPWRWSAKDWAIDLGDKLVLAQATGLAYRRLSTPA